MKIAIPVSGDSISMHFGHCEKFALVDADPDQKTVGEIAYVPAPPHQPGLLPAWLHEQGAHVIIAGGMGQRAVGLFTQHGIQTVLGVAEGSPEDIARQYIEGKLKAGESFCDH